MTERHRTVNQALGLATTLWPYPFRSAVPLASDRVHLLLGL
jgi:hypothetical protein